jgi:hypothetical protein
MVQLSHQAKNLEPVSFVSRKTIKDSICKPLQIRKYSISSGFHVNTWRWCPNSILKNFYAKL